MLEFILDSRKLQKELGGGIAFANIYEVPKNENPQPAMG